MFDATEVVPINFVFFTASAILAGMTNIKLSLHLGYAAVHLRSEVKTLNNVISVHN